MFRISFLLVVLAKLCFNGALPRGEYTTVLSADYVLLQGNLNFSQVAYTLEKVGSAVKLFEKELDVRGDRGGFSQSYRKLITAVYTSVTERFKRISKEALKLPFGEHYPQRVKRSVANVGKRLVAVGAKKIGQKIGSSIIQKLTDSTDNGEPQNHSKSHSQPHLGVL